MGTTIGQKIKELREIRDMTQEEFGRLVGCAQNTVAEWEKRKGRGPNKHFLGRVAQVFGVSIDYLLGVEKLEIPKIPCYGEISNSQFSWPDVNKCEYYIELPQSEYSSGRFSFKILDDCLEPIADKGDYCIFEKLHPQDGDIAIVRFSQNTAIVRLWKQQANKVILFESNIYRKGDVCFFEVIEEATDDLTYTLKEANKSIKIEGKLVAVKRIIKQVKSYPGVKYIFSNTI